MKSVLMKASDVKLKTSIPSTFGCMTVITSAEEGGYVFGSVCLSVCPSYYSHTCERILTKFFGGVGHGSGGAVA